MDTGEISWILYGATFETDEIFKGLSVYHFCVTLALLPL